MSLIGLLSYWRSDLNSDLFRTSDEYSKGSLKQRANTIRITTKAIGKISGTIS